MRSRFCNLAVVIAASVVFAAGIRAQQDPSAAQTPTADQPIFRSAVELVALNVTVWDSRKRFIAGLSRDDFLVYENGIAQQIAFFGVADVPVDLALVLDLSASMADRMRFLRRASSGFLRTLRQGDRAEVIGFNDRVEVLQPLTQELAALEGALGAARAGGQTALYDAVYVTLAELRRERRAYANVRRQVIVVLSDGLDTASWISSDDTLAAARSGGAIIYTIALKMPPTPNQLPPDRFTLESDYTLNLLARDSGGRMFLPKTVNELGAVYESITAEIAHQYVLGYIPSHRPLDGKFRQVAVRVSAPVDAQVRTRNGYYAVAPQ